jgi:putative ABC transport system permease protein
MQNISIGVQPEGFVTAAVTLRSARYPQPEDRLAFQERLMERLRSLPGVDSATIASHSPAAGAMGGPFRLADRDLSDSNGRPPAVSRLAIAPGYFQALGLTMMQGREFIATDGAPGAEGIIVNQTFAAKYWPNENPVGKRIRLGDDPNAPWIGVIGMSPPIFQAGGPTPSINDIGIQPTLYIPYRQESTTTFSVLTRSRIAQETLTSALRNELRNLDPDIPLFNIRSLDETLWQRTWPNRVFGSLFAIFAIIALVMASVGIYGVTAYGVGQRTQEIGIRMALGASGRDVLWMVLRQGLMRISAGMVLGMLAAWGVSRVLSSLLFGVNATDPLTFAGVSILMAAVMAIACVVPARRAMHLHPVDALRTE